MLIFFNIKNKQKKKLNVIQFVTFFFLHFRYTFFNLFIFCFSIGLNKLFDGINHYNHQI